MWSEPLPDWIREELEAGRAERPALRKALIEAQAKCKGLLEQKLKNTEQDYKYTAYFEVLADARNAMIESGITVDQLSSDIEEEITIFTRNGKSAVWKWRVICLVSHVSGGTLLRILRPMTTTGNKASFHARTAADRMLLQTLMRIAGMRDDPTREPEEDRARERRGYGREETPRGARRPPGTNGASVNGAAGQGAPKSSAGPSEPDKTFTPEELAAAKEKTDTVIAEIARATSRTRLVTWGRVLRTLTLPPDESERARKAWRDRCAALELAPRELVGDVNRLGSLPEARIGRDDAGDMYDKADGTLL